MKYWLFTVTRKKDGSDKIAADEIFKIRMQDKFWGVGEKTPNRKNLEKDDVVIFYVGIPSMVLSGEAVLASESFKLDIEQKNKYCHKQSYLTTDYGVFLEKIQIWSKPIEIKPIIENLNFIDNKEFWFAYLQGGIRQISEKDYNIITGKYNPTLIEQISKKKDIESESEFALESHLEEFIHKNWNVINWDEDICLYSTDDQDGRQFPAGIWSIDFLAIEKKTNDLIVIELKRGKTSDATVGQTLRYINWVKENVAEDGQKVKGIIIAKDVDEALRYAIKGLSEISIFTYKVNFSLHCLVD
ncbi:MAG: endonuclease NucS [candidate division Zixibacteria bacterium]|nr:endonuclease NucS [candidate division Zixibacteria bacterium]